MNPIVISFFVFGEPMPQPRPRAAARPTGIYKNGREIWAGRVFDPGTAEEWKGRIWAAATPHVPEKPFLGPLRVDEVFYLPRPKDHFGTGKNAGKLKDSAPSWHTSANRCDRDNLDKCVLDVFQKLGFYLNDSQVCAGEISKLWCPVGQAAGCQITITQLQERNPSSAVQEMFGALGGGEQKEPSGILELFAAQREAAR